MSSAGDKWESLSNAFSRFRRRISQAKTVNINVASLRQEAKDVAKQYFNDARSVVPQGGCAEELEILDQSFRRVLELSAGSNAAASYKTQVRRIQKLLPKVAGRIVLNDSVSEKAADLSQEDARVIETLESLVPSAALSYRQAIRDLADDDRLSFRGPALELRETLREALDHLAPDDDVLGAEGFVLEKGRSGPTMKQKVRFILRSRGQSRSSSTVPEQTTSTVDEMVGTLTRSIYDRSSVATHVAQERRTVLQIRRYIVAILHDILEL